MRHGRSRRRRAPTVRHDSPGGIPHGLDGAPRADSDGTAQYREARPPSRGDRCDIRLIRVTPRPRLARLDRAHDGMTRRLEMGSGVLPWRAVAAAPQATAKAHSEPHRRTALVLTRG